MPTTRNDAAEKNRVLQGPAPDFIIGGAMKSGTSSLHHLLGHHEDVFIPDGEVQFFCLDDVAEHRGAFSKRGSEWTYLDYEAHREEYCAWYQRQFEPAAPGQLIGEDSTTYLPSEKVPARLAEALPDVKLVFMLRDPVARTYSHYWNQLKSGRTPYRFEEQLQKRPLTLLKRSFYQRQVARYLQHFPRGQMKFILFEDFVNNTQRCIDDLCTFLELESSLDLSSLQTRHNPSWYPRWPGLMAWQNRLSRPLYPPTQRYEEFLTARGGSTVPAPGLLKKGLRHFEHRTRYANLQPIERPPMASKTKQFLTKVLFMENRRLPTMIEKDLTGRWPCMRET